MGFFYETDQSAHRIFYLKLESYEEIGNVYKKKGEETCDCIICELWSKFLKDAFFLMNVRERREDSNTSNFTCNFPFNDG